MLQEESLEYEYKIINQVHDKVFKKIMMKKEEAVTIINSVLKEENVKIEAKDIGQYKNEFISSKLRKFESDVIYKMKNENVFFLIEHQTKIDQEMAYRILKYEIAIIDSVLINQRKNSVKEFPEIIPIVVYTGKQKWNAKQDIESMQYKWEKFNGIGLSKYNLIDINEIDDEELKKNESLISKMMIIEKSKTEEELMRNIIDIYKSSKEKSNREETEFIITISKSLAVNKVGTEKAKEIFEKIKLEVGGEEDMLASMEMVRENTLKALADSRRKGIAEGKREGLKKGLVSVIKNMIKKSFSIDSISEVTGYSKEEIEEIEKSMKNTKELNNKKNNKDNR